MQIGSDVVIDDLSDSIKREKPNVINGDYIAQEWINLCFWETLKEHCKVSSCWQNEE